MGLRCVARDSIVALLFNHPRQELEVYPEYEGSFIRCVRFVLPCAVLSDDCHELRNIRAYDAHH